MSLEIPSKDRSYQWMLQWLSQQEQQPTAASASASQSRLVSLLRALSRPQHVGVETQFSQSASGVVSSQFELVPSPGDHSLWYRHRLVQYTRSRDRGMVDMQSGAPWETVTLRCFGRDRQLLLQLLEEARAAALRRQENRTIIFTSSGVEWRAFGQPRRRRPIESVVLDRGVAERLQADLAEFISSQRWYVERGIPYRRGYLLSAEPHTQPH